ncbi:metal-dependent hydrolase [Ciceribacter sp. RN22]|uniref:metal-dependent hydrolase n=1 Tax=Ciceribacter sp. RN22 TaxID=2954932 RepID=UPI0020926665|nr:metal-dependent hydrolase [Ciceribacter sp. RN22]MCO6181039.1 metal-dependent hydrolase [Ciceribacter sp. RN22]
MLIAHFPAGYLLAKGVSFGRRPGRVLFFGIVAGSILPDLDMVYFHLIDNGRTHHHAYISHWPIVWVLLIVLGFGFWAWGRYRATVVGKREAVATAMAGLGIGGLLHMLLDTVAAPLMWLAPFSAQWFEIVSVPPRHSNWVFSFVLHWTFVLELAICLGALLVFFRSRKED